MLPTKERDIASTVIQSIAISVMTIYSTATTIRLTTDLTGFAGKHLPSPHPAGVIRVTKESVFRIHGTAKKCGSAQRSGIEGIRLRPSIAYSPSDAMGSVVISVTSIQWSFSAS
jgi:hypothetical protein